MLDIDWVNLPLPLAMRLVRSKDASTQLWFGSSRLACRTPLLSMRMFLAVFVKVMAGEGLFWGTWARGLRFEMGLLDGMGRCEKVREREREIRLVVLFLFRFM